MADIFGREGAGLGGAFNSSKAAMSISSKGGSIDKLLITNLNGNYAQQVARVFELTSNKVYFIVGRPAGNGSMGSVVGPKKSEAVYGQLADPCNNNILKFSLVGGCDNASNGRTLNGVILESLGFNVAAQDMLINETIGFQFASLSID